ncbi:MAG: hypothetical protein J6C43_05350 [Oscillospiraceae bacterium]|nr:hypothetical protein [Oscillospiraceae bacterium]
MKRIVSIALAAVLALTCCFGSAFANDEIMPLSSPTLMGHQVTMLPGNISGELRISYTVNAKRSADEVGISSIEIYRSTGAYVETIYGTTDNGLVRTSAVKHMATYSYTGAESGEFYYAKVTVYATIDGVTDSETITTATVEAA